MQNPACGSSRECIDDSRIGSLDGSLFEVPAGYTRIQQTPDQILGGGTKTKE
jgi:hypothetical protein